VSVLCLSVLSDLVRALGGAGSRVVKSLDCGARRPRVRIRVLPNVLGSDGIICKYLPLRVYPVFGMHACSLFWFVLIKVIKR